MIRAVLVGPFDGGWRLYRQQQWMAEVRRDPTAADRPRHYFDVEETAYTQALDALGHSEADPPDLDPFAILERLGAIAVARP